MRSSPASAAHPRDADIIAPEHATRAEVERSILQSLIERDARYRDHDLSGDWAGYRECHIKPDLLLIYRKSDPDILRLARLGSHSELFG